jgi:divalent anion:Na+ symporter, DASS family
MDTGFLQVLAAHWPVVAVPAAVTAALLVISRFTARTEAPADARVSTATIAGWVLVLIAPPVVYLGALAAQFSVQASIFAALLAGTVLLWVFGLVDEYVGPLVAVVGTLFVGLAPPEVALAGFASPSLLLLVGVFALSAAISSSGLSYRLIVRLLLRLPDRPFFHQSALLFSGYALSPLMPSTNARMALLTPAYRDMADGLRLAPGGPGRTALLAAMFGGAALFSPMMVTSKSSNIASVNFLPAQLQAEFNGIFWLVAAAAAALTVTVVHLAVIPRLFPTGDEAPLPREQLRRRLAELGPLSAPEWAAAACFVFFLVGIATTGWHHLKPPYLAGVVLLALLLTGTLLRKDFRSKLDWPMIFFLLGLDSMVRIMGYLGLQDALARSVQHYFDFVDGNIAAFVAVCLLVTLTVRLVLPVTAGALTAAVILLPIATAQGINPWIAVFCAAIFSDMSFFRYQGSNGLLQLHSEGLMAEADRRGFMRYNLLMNLGRVAAVYASLPWWNLLGLI